MLGKHFLSLHHFTASDLNKIISRAATLKSELRAGVPHPLLKGKTMAMIFQQPSNRTRISFEVGMNQLGGFTLNIRPDEIQLASREPIPDVARVMSRYVDVVMMRVAKHSTLTEFAAASSVPVVNGLCDKFHPCQAASDMLTIQEHKGRLEGLKMCYIGDGNNVCVSLIHACNLMGMKITVACPKGYEPTLDGDFDYELSHTPAEAIRNSDVVYTDVWTSMGQEEESERRRQKFKGFTITKELFEQASAEALFMHCLPAHRGEEVTHDVVEHPRSIVFDQAENRLHVQKAILAGILSS